MFASEPRDALLHAVWSVSIKGSRDPLAFNGLQACAGAGLGLVLLPLFPLSEIPTAVWGLVALTGVAHAFYFYWMARAYALADLSLVYPIARSTPAFLPLLAVPLLGESISPLGAAGILAVVAGIWGVQAAEGFRWRALFSPGIGFAYLTLAATIAYSLIDKASMSRLDGLRWSGALPRAFFYMCMLEVTCGICFLPLVLRRVSAAELFETARGEWIRVLAAVAISLTGYGLILEALRTAPASYVVAARQLSVLFAVGLSIVWLGERPGRGRVLGAAATVIGVGMISFAR